MLANLRCMHGTEQSQDMAFGCCPGLLKRGIELWGFLKGPYATDVSQNQGHPIWTPNNRSPHITTPKKGASNSREQPFDNSASNTCSIIRWATNQPALSMGDMLSKRHLIQICPQWFCLQGDVFHCKLISAEALWRRFSTAAWIVKQSCGTVVRLATQSCFAVAWAVKRRFSTAVSVAKQTKFATVASAAKPRFLRRNLGCSSTVAWAAKRCFSFRCNLGRKVVFFQK